MYLSNEVYKNVVRSPKQLPPTWNLAKLMTPLSWVLTFSSMVAVVLFFNMASQMVMRFMGMRVRTRELTLFPFR